MFIYLLFFLDYLEHCSIGYVEQPLVNPPTSQRRACWNTVAFSYLISHHMLISHLTSLISHLSDIRSLISQILDIGEGIHLWFPWKTPTGCLLTLLTYLLTYLTLLTYLLWFYDFLGKPRLDAYLPYLLTYLLTLPYLLTMISLQNPGRMHTLLTLLTYHLYQILSNPLWSS